jgi:hypothetical protein
MEYGGERNDETIKKAAGRILGRISTRLMNYEHRKLTQWGYRKMRMLFSKKFLLIILTLEGSNVTFFG